MTRASLTILLVVAVILAVGCGASSDHSGSVTKTPTGEWIVWVDERDGEDNADIYALDLTTGEERLVRAVAGAQYASAPDISGQWVVWMEQGDHDLDVYALNLATGEERAMCTAEGNQGFPDISGDRVVWTDARNGEDSDDIYAYNLKTGEERAICTAAGAQYAPAVSVE